ncbi:MAG: prephenate dehydrogenase [Fimbriiglobus sp.]
MLVEHLTIVGVGLLGGSVGLAAKVRDVAGRVVGVGRSEVLLARAKAVGAIDSFTTDLAAGVAAADLIVVCTPVDRVAADVIAVAAAAKPTALITDVGSTKANIVAELAGKLPPRAAKFVGSHPLAGSEKTGADHARPDLFSGRVVIVTPTGNDDLAAAKRAEEFWQALGATTVRMSPTDHDVALAITSHLPHAAAAGLAGVTPVEWLNLSAGGFRDCTRIAAGDPALWAAIFDANRGAVLAALDRFADRMAAFRAALAAGDSAAVAKWLTEAKQVRDALGS